MDINSVPHQLARLWMISRNITRLLLLTQQTSLCRYTLRNRFNREFVFGVDRYCKRLFHQSGEEKNIPYLEKEQKSDSEDQSNITKPNESFKKTHQLEHFDIKQKSIGQEQASIKTTRFSREDTNKNKTIPPSMGPIILELRKIPRNLTWSEFEKQCRSLKGVLDVWFASPKYPDLRTCILFYDVPSSQKALNKFYNEGIEALYIQNSIERSKRTVLYVYKLPKTFSIKMLSEMFQDFGGRVQLPGMYTNVPGVFVYFETHEQAVKAYNTFPHTDYGTYQMKICWGIARELTRIQQETSVLTFKFPVAVHWRGMHQTFNSLGAITYNVNKNKPEGYTSGFINFRNHTEADIARFQLRKIKVDGHQIEIDFAKHLEQPAINPSEQSEEGKRVLYFSNLPGNIDEQVLVSEFKNYGAYGAKIMHRKSPISAIVIFSSNEGAAKAMNDYHDCSLDGQSLYISYGKGISLNNEKKLSVIRFSKLTNDEGALRELKALAESMRAKSFRVMHTSNDGTLNGLILFHTPAAAEYALTQLRFRLIYGRAVSITFPSYHLRKNELS